MKISRRAVLGVAVGVVGAAAAGVGVAAFAGPGVRPAAPLTGGAKYQPGPGDPRLKGPGDMVMQVLSTRWHSHLLPFAAPFSDKTTLVAELKRARAQRLFV